jgi:phage baseplate assembly protein W
MAMNPKDQGLLRERVLGWGLACEPVLPGVDLGRDIRIASGPDGADVALVRQMDNFAQSLQIAFTTRLGDDVFNVRFGYDGLNALADETNPIIQRERIRIGVIQLLQKDPRVQRIVDVSFVTPSRESRIARQAEVRATFETASGESAALTLGKVSSNG